MTYLNVVFVPFVASNASPEASSCPRRETVSSSDWQYLCFWLNQQITFPSASVVLYKCLANTRILKLLNNYWGKATYSIPTVLYRLTATSHMQTAVCFGRRWLKNLLYNSSTLYAHVRSSDDGNLQTNALGHATRWYILQSILSSGGSLTPHLLSGKVMFLCQNVSLRWR